MSRARILKAVLALFDIDGTLLQAASAAHAQSMRCALYEVYGVGDAEGSAGSLPTVSAAGRTDLEIAREILLLCGRSAESFQEGLEQLREACVREYAMRVPEDLSDHVVEGMGRLLSELSTDPRVHLALLTGNLEPIARIKLARARIGGYFPAGQGAFGSDSSDRSDLPGIARRRAGTEGVSYPRSRTVIIGDTPRDIACARADGVEVFAVTTGPFAEHELQAADGVAAGIDQLRDLLLSKLQRHAT